MGGGGGSHKTEYEPERRGVSKRSYGAIASDGIQSREEYEMYVEALKNGGKVKEVFGVKGIGGKLSTGLTSTMASSAGLSYDSKWDRWKMGNGVDLEAALADWQNYESERIEIAGYEAKEARRMAAPDDLAGTKGTVDSTLGIKDDKKDKDKTVGGSTTTVDESPTTASSNQSLGIY